MRARSLCLFAFFTLITIVHGQTLQWAQATGGASQEVWKDVAIDGSGNAVTVGTLLTGGAPVDLDPGAGQFNVLSIASSYDVFYRKMDANGGFIWGGSFGGTTTDAGLSVAVDASGNVFLAGSVVGANVDLDPTAGVFPVSTSNSGADAFVVKLSSTGTFLWGRIFGGLGSDVANAIAADSDGGVWITGVLGNGGDLDPGAGSFPVTGNGLQDIFITKLDGNGAFLWGGSIGGNANDIGRGIAITPDGHAVVCGEFRTTADFDPGAGTVSRSSAGDADMFVLRLDGNGVLQWANRFGGTGFETARSVACDGAGNIVFTGEVTSPTDMDAGPGTANLPGSFSEPSFIAKLDGASAHQWSFLLSGFINKGNAVAVGPQGEVYATGTFGGTMDVDPGPGTTNLVQATGSDGYVLRYSPVGTLEWGFKLDASSASMLAENIAVSPASTVVLAGAFPGSMDMDPGPGSSIITSAGSTDAYTGVYAQAQACQNARVALKAMLEGPYRTANGLMVDSLRVRGFLPLDEPYTAAGFTITGGGTIAPAVLAVSGPDAIVDWVVVELRSEVDPALLVESRAALIQRDGDVVAPDGLSPVSFCAPDGNYVVALRHRNHLGVATATHQSLTGAPTSIDLTLSSTPVFGTDPRHDLNGVWVSWPGNVVLNTVVGYTGAANDRDPILVAVGSTTPNNTVHGYLSADVNMDGTAKYTGSGNDRDLVLLTVGSTTPNVLRAEQLP